MGDYLLLQWLQTRRGVIFCVVLLIWTATASLCRLGASRSVDPQPDRSAAAIHSVDGYVSVVKHRNEEKPNNLVSTPRKN
jgi:hypothetical protein